MSCSMVGNVIPVRLGMRRGFLLSRPLCTTSWGSSHCRWKQKSAHADLKGSVQSLLGGGIVACAIRTGARTSGPHPGAQGLRPVPHASKPVPSGQAPAGKVMLVPWIRHSGDRRPLEAPDEPRAGASTSQAPKAPRLCLSSHHGFWQPCFLKRNKGFWKQSQRSSS